MIRPLALVLVVVLPFYYALGVRVCSDGSAPTCADGSAPVRDMDRGTAPCPGQGRGRAGKPSSCPDGQPPARQRRGGRGRGQARQRGGRGQPGQQRQGGGNRGRAGGNKKCSKSERVCCDGSTPNFARDGRRTPQCSNGRKAKCSCRKSTTRP